jgi:uncharacterized protein (DUF169 family)
MESRLAATVHLETEPVAVLFSDEMPEAAVKFPRGKWGCVVSMFVAASRGAVVAFDSQTHGCRMGGVSLCLRDRAVEPMGGLDYYLSHGRGEGYPADERFPEGERYIKTPELAREFIQGVPAVEIPAQYVILMPVSKVDLDRDHPVLAAMFADPDQISALHFMANYDQPGIDNVIMPWGAGCHTLSIYPYHEAQSERPRAVIGCVDIAVRKYFDSQKLSFTVPWSMFMRMEQNVPGSFLVRDSWQQLLSRRQRRAQAMRRRSTDRPTMKEEANTKD